jgi:hypothetical protein
VDFTIRNEAGDPVFTKLATDGKIGFRPDQAGTYTVYPQFHEGPGTADNQYPVTPYSFTVYNDERHFHTTLLEQYSHPIPLKELQKRLDPWQLPIIDWEALRNPPAIAELPTLPRDQHSRLDYIAAKLVPQWEVQTSIPVPSIVEFSKDAAPILLSLGKRHDYRVDHAAHNPSYHWFAIVGNSGHKHARKLGNEFAQFAGLYAIDLREAARHDARNHSSGLDAIGRPETTIPVRFDSPDTYRIICIEYENGQPQRGPAWIGSASKNWIYGVTEYAPVTVLDSASYAVAQAAPAQQRKRLEDAMANQEAYRQRVNELRGEFEDEPIPLQAIHIEKRTGIVTPLPLSLFFGAKKGEPSRYLLVDLTRQSDGKGGENPHVHRVFEGSPHIAIQYLANWSAYPEGFIHVSLPNLKGQRVDSFSTFSIATHGAPWPERLGASLLSGWPVSLTVAGSAVAVNQLAKRGVIAATTALAAGTALSAIAVPVMAAGVVGLGLYTVSHATADVVNSVAVGVDVVNLAACLLGGAAMAGSLPRVAMALETQLAQRAVAADAAGHTAIAAIVARAAGASQGRELVFWANTANLTAIAADSGVLIAPEILHQIQIISQSGMPEAEKQVAVQGLIKSALSLGLLILVGPNQDYAEARAIVAKRVAWVREKASQSRNRLRLQPQKEEFPRGFPVMGGASDGLDDLMTIDKQVGRINEILKEEPTGLTADKLTELVDLYSSVAKMTGRANELDKHSHVGRKLRKQQETLRRNVHPAVRNRLETGLGTILLGEPVRQEDIATALAALGKFSQLPESEPFLRELRLWTRNLERFQTEIRLLESDPQRTSDFLAARAALTRIKELLALKSSKFSGDSLVEMWQLYGAVLSKIEFSRRAGSESSLIVNWTILKSRVVGMEDELATRHGEFLTASLRGDLSSNDRSKLIQMMKDLPPTSTTEKLLAALERVQGQVAVLDGQGNSIPSLYQQLRVFIGLTDSELSQLGQRLVAMNLNSQEAARLEAVFSKMPPGSKFDAIQAAIDDHVALRKIETLLDRKPEDLSTQQLAEIRVYVDRFKRELRDLEVGTPQVEGSEQRRGVALLVLDGAKLPLLQTKLDIALKIEQTFPAMLLAALQRVKKSGVLPGERQAAMGLARSIPAAEYGPSRGDIGRAISALKPIFSGEGYVVDSVNEGLVMFAGRWPTSSSTDDVIRTYRAKPNGVGNELKIDSFPTSKTVKLADGNMYDLVDVRLYTPEMPL